MNELKLPPQNMEAEQSLLGAVMLDQRIISDLMAEVDKVWFYSRHHSTIWDAVSRLYDGDDPIDVVTVSDKLSEMGKLEETGGLAYLGTLSKNVPTTANIKTYANIVREKYYSRLMIMACRQIEELSYSEQSAEDKLDAAGEILSSLVVSKGSEGLRSIRDITIETLDAIEERSERGDEITGVPTGYPALDARWDGLNSGDLIILAARPSMGKTALAMNICTKVSRNHRVLVFDLEMTSIQLCQRMFSSLSSVNNFSIRRGLMGKDDWPKITKASAVMVDLKMEVDDTRNVGLSYIRTNARRRGKDGVGLIMVDYLQIMNEEMKSTNESRVVAIGRITRGLKELGKELGCAVLLLSQLNRDLEKRSNKRPILADLRDSGAIEQDADIVAFLYRDEVYDEDSQAKGMAEVITAKARNGEPGIDFLRFNGATTVFSSTVDRPPPAPVTTDGFRD